MERYFTRLNQEHNRPIFESGEDEIDEWFRQQARQAEFRFNSARTWVLADREIDEGRRVLGYHSLAAHSVEWTSLPREHGRGQPKSGVPAVLIARLGRDLHWRGEGLGDALLRHAIKMTLQANEFVAAPLMVVDAIHDVAAEWYAERGFIELSRATPRRIRLVAKLQALATVLDLSQTGFE